MPVPLLATVYLPIHWAVVDGLINICKKVYETEANWLNQFILILMLIASSKVMQLTCLKYSNPNNRKLPRKCCPPEKILNESLDCVEYDLNPIPLRFLSPLVAAPGPDSDLPACPAGEQYQMVLLQHSFEQFPANLSLDLSNMCQDSMLGLNGTQALVLCSDQSPRIGTLAKCCATEEVFDETSDRCQPGSFNVSLLKWFWRDPASQMIFGPVTKPLGYVSMITGTLTMEDCKGHQVK